MDQTTHAPLIDELDNLLENHSALWKRVILDECAGFRDEDWLALGVASETKPYNLKHMEVWMRLQTFMRLDRIKTSPDNRMSYFIGQRSGEIERVKRDPGSADEGAREYLRRNFADAVFAARNHGNVNVRLVAAWVAAQLEQQIAQNPNYLPLLRP